MCKIFHKDLAHVIMEDGEFKLRRVGQQMTPGGRLQEKPPLLRRLAFEFSAAFDPLDEAVTVGSTVCVTQSSLI